ncbi:MAG: DUF5681 domain-containing protein [Bacteroidota bacterium]
MYASQTSIIIFTVEKQLKMPNPENLNKRKPFVKNDPRINKKGQPHKLPNLDILLAKVLGEDKGNMNAMEEILRKLKKKALAGDTKSAEILLARAYGKINQNIQLDVKDVKMPIINIQYREKE